MATDRFEKFIRSFWEQALADLGLIFNRQEHTMIRMHDGALACPHCDAADGLQPAGGEVHELGEYHGPVGTLN